MKGRPMNKDKINEELRKSFNNILTHKPTAKELFRKKEIEKIALQEKEEYDKKRAEFYNNPLHWDNNKRRRFGFPVLRKDINKYRSKRYPSFHPTTYLMSVIEDVIEETLTNKFENNDFFGKFVDINDIMTRNTKEYYIDK